MGKRKSFGKRVKNTIDDGIKRVIEFFNRYGDNVFLFIFVFLTIFVITIFNKNLKILSQNLGFNPDYITSIGISTIYLFFLLYCLRTLLMRFLKKKDFLYKIFVRRTLKK